MIDGEIGIIVCVRNRLVLWHGTRAEALLRLPHFSAMEYLHPTRADYRMLTAMPAAMPFWARHSLAQALRARDYDATLKALAIPLSRLASFSMPTAPADDDAVFLPFSSWTTDERP
jgi:hypothetical protein